MKKMTDLTSDQIGRIVALYQVRGATRGTVGHVAKTWQITESDARALGTAATTKPKPTTTRTITESGAPAGALNDTDPRKVHLAERLAQSVNEADARIDADGGSLAGLSIQQLQALAAAAGAEAGMFG
jgi:lysozyme family protein